MKHFSNSSWNQQAVTEIDKFSSIYKNMVVCLASQCTEHWNNTTLDNCTHDTEHLIESLSGHQHSREHQPKSSLWCCHCGAERTAGNGKHILICNCPAGEGLQ